MELSDSAPTCVESWIQTVLAFIGEESIRNRIEPFLKQETSRKIISDWIINKDPPQLCMTDMSDAYKLSMLGVFAKIQKKLGDALEVTFTLNVRQTSELSVEELFKLSVKDGPDKDTWLKIRDAWLHKLLNITGRPFDVSLLKDASEGVNPAIKGCIRLEQDTLEWLASNPQSTAIKMEIFLKPKGEKSLEKWYKIDASGECVKATLDGIADTLENVVNTLATGFEVIVDAAGPWPLVTFFETSLMQVTAESLARGMQVLRGWDDCRFYAESLALLDARVEFLKQEKLGESGFNVVNMAGRRTPHVALNLLQNLWVAKYCEGYIGTSSLFAWRVFRTYGWISEDSSPKHPDLNIIGGQKFYLVGTHAHEGSMAFQAIAAEADEEMEYPISSVLWHMNYWMLNGNLAILPDTVGSPAFAYLLSSLEFPPKYVEDFNSRHGAVRKLKGVGSILETLGDPAVGGLIRQDSGDLKAFMHIFTPAVVRKNNQWLDPSTGAESSFGFKNFASEIGNDPDVKDARAHGYMGMGTGGYLGEKPWAAQKVPQDNYKDVNLNGKIDLVAKISEIRVPGNSQVFFPVKLGDYATLGNWHATKPGKFAITPKLKGTESPEEAAAWTRFQRQGEVVGSGAHFNEKAKHLINISNYDKDQIRSKTFDEMSSVDRQSRFNNFWDRFNFV